MADYRMYTIGPDGHFVGSRNFVCDNDEHAIEWAKQSLEHMPIELWNGERLVKSLSPSDVVARGGAVSHEVHKGRMVPKDG